MGDRSSACVRQLQQLWSSMAAPASGTGTGDWGSLGELAAPVELCHLPGLLLPCLALLLMLFTLAQVMPLLPWGSQQSLHPLPPARSVQRRREWPSSEAHTGVVLPAWPLTSKQLASSSSSSWKGMGSKLCFPLTALSNFSSCHQLLSKLM